MTQKFANHLRAYFSDSAFIRNKDNANYVAKSYMMAQKMCENTGFLDITDIYASDICLVEHSYGYDSTEYMLSDTQVVTLEGKLEEGDYDTDRDEVSDRDEIGVEEEVNISRLLEAYIKYNELDQVEADKLRADPIVKMYNYVSNPVLPDSDFDGRDDRRDRARALDNSYTFDMDTLNNEQIHFDFNMDYRYFFMDSTKYYPELSDMSLALSNMIGKHKGLSDKKFKNRNDKELYEERGMSNYLWYIGQEDIEERNTGVVPYTISHREVFLRKGKVNHKLRNIITIVIGEDERYKGMLSANIDGSYNSDGDYEEYHHVGFDIEANKIVEDIEEYIDNQYGTKVFWITGFGSGGSIANLVGQKLTKKKGVSNVYCYTFESFATINANNIEDVNSFDYRRYINIFNMENDDDLMIKLLDRDVGWYKYGRSVRGSAAQLNTKISSILGDNYRGSNGKKQYNGSPKTVSKVLNNILDAVKNILNNVSNAIRGLVSGFTETGPTIYENPGPGNPVTERVDENINLSPQNILEAKENNHKLVVINGPGSSYVNISPSDEIPVKDSNTQEAAVLANNDKGQNTEEQAPKPNKAGEGRNSIDGYPFKDSYDMGVICEREIDFDYQKDKVSNEDWCIKIGNFKYSNYTIPYGETTTYDISYSQFWSESSREVLQNKRYNYRLTPDYQHYFLYNNDAGDFSKSTTDMMYGRYHTDSDRKMDVNQRKDAGTEIITGEDDYKLELTTIDGRILTAAPLHLLIKTVATDEDGEDEVIKDLYHNEMHIYSNYVLDSRGHISFKNTGQVNEVALENKKFKYMDVVVLSSEGYQYVVPFIVVDVKWLHNEESGHYSYLTDNTYGHVNELINGTKHEFSRMNPIEPFLGLKKGRAYYDGEVPKNVNADFNNKIKAKLFGSDKIVSMRLYDKQYDENNPNWWKNIRDSMQEMTEYNNIRKTKAHNGKVVNYE